MSKKRVLKLVNTSIRDDPRAINEGMSLVKLGYDVTIIGMARDREGTHRVHDTLQGMKTVLVPMVTTSHPKHLLRAVWRLLRGYLETNTEIPTSRMSNPISFVFFNFWLLRVALKIKLDVLHCHDVLPLPAAWVLSRWHRVPLIYDARESVPDLYTGFKRRIMASIEQFILIRADAVITVGERLAKSLENRGAKQVVIIGNWKRLEDYEVSAERLETESQKLNLKSTDCVISYFGALDPTREIIPLLEAVTQSEHVILLIGGRGMIEDRVKQAAEKTSNIRWLGWVPMSDIPLYTHLSTAVYYCLNMDQQAQQDLSIGNNYYSTPNKLFEAFAAGKVIIARRGVGEIADILEKIQAGILLDEVTSASLIDAFKQLNNKQHLQEMQQATKLGRQMYNWDIAESKLALLYAKLEINTQIKR